MKILIVRLGSFGDIVHAIPVQQQLADLMPGGEIQWLSEPPYVPFLKCVPGVSRIWAADTKKWKRNPSALRELPALLSGLRRQHFDLALDFQGLAKSALLARLSGATRVIGFRSRDLRERWAAPFYTERIVPMNNEDAKRHVIEKNFSFLRHLGWQTAPRAEIRLEIPLADSAYIDENLRQLKISRPVLIHPGAGRLAKRWQPASFAQLAQKIIDILRLEVVLSYGPGEESLIESLRSYSAPVCLPAFPTTFLQLAALCRRAQLFIGGDTGPLHLAVSLGTPCVALMGSRWPAWRNGPYHPTDIAIDSAGGSDSSRTPIEVSVDRALEAVKKRLQYSRGGLP
ncbi:MAG: glycosyltransferase family 9 protein [Acidobacteria bacterium]|nr:glycosyltransferase family 9 protein [Acidobacteriota bacterium]